MNHAYANLVLTDFQTPLFNATLADHPINPPTPLPPTKRQKHRAGRLTDKVWAAICANPNGDTSALTVTTQEIPEVTK